MAGPEVNDDYRARFGALDRLYGRGALERLAAAHVAVVGVGGVGSWTVEALARSGVGRMTLVDLDDVCVTNANRQLHATVDAVGRPKVRVLEERVRAINPACVVTVREEFFTAATADGFLAADRFDWVVDAIDSLSNKCLLIARCHAAGVPVVTCGGAGGRRSSAEVRVADLAFTERDQLLKYVRKKLRARHGFPRDDREPFEVMAVYSPERPVYPWSDGSVCEDIEGGSETAINCASGIGTAAFVTGAFGFAAASVVVTAIASGGAENSASAEQPSKGGVDVRDEFGDR
ncbi:tRNA cyclic N6-threonylcarbamoyladenosine(37) synthase TcdA [Opitutales bacterium ASA1]|uniref:tRNA threonylcarbamoyladenosine dehydratase n=1 Tax=Congregicoccus parvus TaxID=3081749 RepID=UPI002B2FDB36|nr:tRNA cyclic N6-threonylcarbamoyladenosine(37) synthase TcdA [Opitutales bacterium ASA1]